MKRNLLGVLLLVLVASVAGAQTVTVTKPALNETWVKGQTYTIIWTKSGTMPNTVRISLRDKTGTAEIKLIGDNLANSGSYQWLVPADVADGQYVIRVKVKNATIQDDSDIFNIAASAPPAGTLTVTKPASGNTWTQGQSYAITWTQTGSLPNQVALSLMDSTATTVVKTIADPAPNNGSYSWQVAADVPVGSYKVRVKAKGTAVQDDSDAFAIAAPALNGTITVTKPGLNETWVKGQSYAITWTKSGSLPANVVISLMDSAGAAVVKTIAASAPDSGTYASWLVPPDVADGQYKVRVKAEGANIQDDGDLFKIAAVAPAGTITVTKPAAGEVWNNGQIQTINWTWTGNLPGQVAISLMNSTGTVIVEDLATPTANSGNVTGTFAIDIAPGSYRVRVKSYGADVYGDSQIFAVSPNSIKITQPTAGSNWQETKTYTIAWTRNGSLAGTVAITLVTENKLKSWVIADPAPNTGSYSWTVPGNIPIGKYYIWILVKTSTIDNTSNPFNITLSIPMVPVKVKK